MPLEFFWWSSGTPSQFFLALVATKERIPLGRKRAILKAPGLRQKGGVSASVELKGAYSRRDTPNPSGPLPPPFLRLKGGAQTTACPNKDGSWGACTHIDFQPHPAVSHQTCSEPIGLGLQMKLLYGTCIGPTLKPELIFLFWSRTPTLN